MVQNNIVNKKIKITMPEWIKDTINLCSKKYLEGDKISAVNAFKNKILENSIKFSKEIIESYIEENFYEEAKRQLLRYNSPISIHELDLKKIETLNSTKIKIGGIPNKAGIYFVKTKECKNWKGMVYINGNVPFCKITYFYLISEINNEDVFRRISSDEIIENINNFDFSEKIDLETE